MAIPAALATITTPGGSGLGCSHIITGDLHDRGRDDQVVQWEGSADWYIHLLRNDGNFRLTEVTVRALGGYATGYGEGNRRRGPAKHHLRDIDGAGRLEIVLALGFIDLVDEEMLRHLAFHSDGEAGSRPGGRGWRPARRRCRT